MSFNFNLRRPRWTAGIAATALALGGLVGVVAPASGVTVDSSINPTVARAGESGVPFVISITGLPAGNDCTLAETDLTWDGSALRFIRGRFLDHDGTATISGVVPVNNTVETITATWSMILHNCNGSGDGTYTDSVSFSYIEAPVITSVSPAWSPVEGGKVVILTGLTLGNVTAVKFGSTSVAPSSKTATSVTVTAPAHSAGLVDITVQTSDPYSYTKANAFTYYNTPVITAIAPTAGPVGGGTSVVLTGFFGPSVPTVKFGSTTVASGNVSVNGDRTQITAISPAGTPGPVTVMVTQEDGSATAPALFTYADFSVTGISTEVGSISRNEDVTITGTNLTLATVVAFGATNGTTKSVSVDGTSLVVTIPDHAAGVVTVTATQGARTRTVTSNFRFTDAPTITDVSPAIGSLGGGTPVIIKGTNFYGLTGATAVKFGTTNATSYVVDSPTQITAIAPASATEGAVRVSVTNPQDTALAPLTELFTYTAPTFTGLTPVVGAIAGGTHVTITGTNLHGAIVKFDNTNATLISVSTDGTTMLVHTPAHVAGLVNVTVVAGSKSVTRVGAFTYLGLPTVTDISPDSARVTGGIDVVITGTNLQAVTSVTFDGAQGRNIRLSTDGKTLTVTVPSSSRLGAVAVVVSAPNGSVTVSGGFTYLPNCQPQRIGMAKFAKMSANLSKLVSAEQIAAYARAIKASGCTTVTIKRWAPGAVSDPVLKAMKALTQQRYLALVNQLRIQLERLDWNVTFVKAKLPGQILSMTSVDQYPANRVFRILVG